MNDIVNHDTHLDAVTRLVISSRAMTIAKRIAQARKGKFTQETLAEAIGAAQSTVASWETGKNEPDLKMIERIATKTKMDPAWIAFARAQTSAIIDGERYTSVPMYDIDAAAGAGAIAEEENPTGYRLFETDWLRDMTRSPASKLAVIKVRGDSMQETLFNGDHVLVDLNSRHLAREGIYVISVENRLQVKRITMHPKTKLLTVRSDNQNYPTYTDLTVDDLEVVGRVIWLGRNVG